jgi:hypothetical protein
MMILWALWRTAPAYRAAEFMDALEGAFHVLGVTKIE